MVSSLPRPLLVHIIEYAANFTHSLYPYKRTLPLKFLQNLTLVCKSIHEQVDKITNSLQNEVFSLGFEDFAAPENVQDAIEEIQAYGAPVRDFRLRLGLYEPNQGPYDPRRFNLRPTIPGDVEDLEIDWSTMFRSMPGLKRLDLTMVSLLSVHLIDILVAAPECCPNLEILILPSKDDFFGVMRGPIFAEIMTFLVAALEKWFVEGNCGGLRQLSVPSCDAEDNALISSQLFEAVTRFCPRIEYLNGFQQALDPEAADCSDMWSISLEKWRNFNATCTSLRAFNWTLIPFGDPFFQAFGDCKKPQLEALSLTANMSWGYEHYLREFPGSIERVDEFDAHPGYGVSAHNVGAALRGCPALTKLSILIDHETNEESHERYVDPFSYRDEFWEAVASSCPLLKSIQMVDTSNHRLALMRPIDTLTGRTLVALASLKSLGQCKLDPARLSGQEIFEYLQLVSKNAVIDSERVLDISIGGHQSSRLAKFYAVIVTLLKLLSETREDSLGAASCPTNHVLLISNPYESKVRVGWCEGYMRDELKPLLTAVKAMHPSLALRVEIVGRSGNKFTRIAKLTLSWRPQSGAHPLFSDISEETSGRDSDSDVSIYSRSDNEDESMSEDEEGNLDL